jgi:hypothetical protein
VNRNVKSNDGQTIALCAYRWTDADGHVSTCRAHAKCPVCGQCSKIIDNKEIGHCPGHLGLMDDPLRTVPDRGTL